MTKKNKSPFGYLLTDLIKKSGLTQVDFYSQLEITKPYFYDIISGKSNPPPPEMQIKIIKILNLSKEDRESLLTEASIARREIPDDIQIYLKAFPDEIKNIRNNFNFKQIL